MMEINPSSRKKKPQNYGVFLFHYFSVLLPNVYERRKHTRGVSVEMEFLTLPF